ncbi:MAG: iron chelate uptake ABC transporter family permease subunit [Aeromicrobium sp.]
MTESPSTIVRRDRAAVDGTRRVTGLAIAVVVLLVAMLASVAVGSRMLPLPDVWRLLWSPDGSPESTIIHDLRVPRTVIALVVGAALGLAGALMQSLTRNPLADPGILGINAGASLAVVSAVALTGMASIGFYLWFAFAGAAAASVLVYVLGSAGRSQATPARLALAGVAITAAISALVQTVILTDQEAFNEFRFWVVGSLEGRGFTIIWTVAPFIACGVVIALALGPALNALALGDETGSALGVDVRRTRLLAVVAVTLLCGAATAAVGPIGFIGLGVPYLARAVCGPDQRWVMPYCLVLAPALLLVADVLARIVIAPQEVQAGIVTALLGGPVFIAIVRRPRIEAL